MANWRVRPSGQRWEIVDGTSAFCMTFGGENEALAVADALNRHAAEIARLKAELAEIKLRAWGHDQPTPDVITHAECEIDGARFVALYRGDVDSVTIKGATAAITRFVRDDALAAAVQAEREACLAVVRDRANRHKAAAMAIPNISDPIRYNHECRQYELNAMADVLSLRPSPAPAVGEWRLERSGLWRFVVGERCLASVSTNINRWYTFSPGGSAGESGYVADLESAKRAAVDALVRQGWITIGGIKIVADDSIPAGELRAVAPSPIDSVIDDMVRILRDPGADAEEKHMALSTLADAVEVKMPPPPGVDVLAVAREYLEARAQCNPCWSPAVKRYQVALDALRALVAPRTAEESSGVANEI